eukprot:g3658.t1
MYEKRKLAALEVEQIMKKLASTGEREKVKHLLGTLVDEYAVSGHANRRKGGLLCLAAATVALKYDYEALNFNFLGQIIMPVAASLNDQDPRVRYYACEAMYNIAKATQEEFISNQELFLEVFSALFNLYGDVDGNVQNAAQHLDEVLQTIVTSSSKFDVKELMLLLRDCLYARNVHKRQFLIGWVVALFSMPSLDMLPFLPEILPGLMSMLEDNHQEIRQLVANTLKDFLMELAGSADESVVDYVALLKVLLESCHSMDTTTCQTSLQWLNVVVEVALPEVLSQYGPIVGTVLSSISHPNLEVQRVARSVNTLLLQSNIPASWQTLDMEDLLKKINKELSSNQEPTRFEALSWLEFLLRQRPAAVLAECESIVNAVLDALTMHWNRVVKSGINLLGILAQQESQFRVVMEALLQRFQGKEGLKLLHSSGAFVIQRLAQLSGAKVVFSELAFALESDKFDTEFASTMVQALNVLLVTSPELIDLPRLLREGLSNSETKEFFLVLFPAWSKSVCAVLTICFLARAYELAWKLIKEFGDSLYGTSADAMVQIVRLVKLIEAPAFGFLRLELIQHEQNPYLMKSLHGLLMLLPQTDAFHTLVDRLKSVPPYSCNAINQQSSKEVEQEDFIDYDKLLETFVQNRSINERDQSENTKAIVPVGSDNAVAFFK